MIFSPLILKKLSHILLKTPNNAAKVGTFPNKGKMCSKAGGNESYKTYDRSKQVRNNKAIREATYLVDNKARKEAYDQGETDNI